MTGRILTRAILLSVIFLSSMQAAMASRFVHGRIYLKDGTVIECAEDDRIRLPRRSGNAKFLKNAYTDEKEKQKFGACEIDSIVVWSPDTPEHIRKFIPSEKPGWLWVYFETPEVCVCVYSSKGYGVGSNGGIEVYEWRGYIFRSRTAYCLRRHGEKEFETIGTTVGRSSARFRKRLAAYVSDDPDLAEMILESRGRRDKTVLMLKSYIPEVQED